MAGGPAFSSAIASPRVAELDRALDDIGVTRAHHTIIFLILIGCLFDSFEQNAVGIVGPLLRQQWNLSVSDIGLLNSVTFACARTRGPAPRCSSRLSQRVQHGRIHRQPARNDTGHRLRFDASMEHDMQDPLLK
jgi:hypothetical protein